MLRSKPQLKVEDAEVEQRIPMEVPGRWKETRLGGRYLIRCWEGGGRWRCT